MPKDNNCIFCKIVNKEVSSYCIHEDDKVFVFLDNDPNHNGHTLIIPKEHILDINNISNEMLIHINDVSKQIQALLEERLKVKGMTYLHNSGNAQNVKHFHQHIIPRDKFSTEEEIMLPVEEVYNKIVKK